MCSHTAGLAMMSGLVAEGASGRPGEPGQLLTLMTGSLPFHQFSKVGFGLRDIFSYA